jgi:leucyl aminopeptidase
MKIVLIPQSQKRASADLLVIGFFEKEKLHPEVSKLEPHFGKAVESAIKKGRFEGKFGQNFSSYQDTFSEASELIIFGLGQKSNYKQMCFRKAMGQIIGIAKSRKVKRLRIHLDSFLALEVKQIDALGLLAEISILTPYEFNRYKTKSASEAKAPQLEAVEILFAQGKSAELSKKVESAQAIAEGVIFARNLINEPGNVMNPERLAKSAEEWAEEKGVHCEILRETELKRLKMGGILAVNQGSNTPASLITMEYGERFKKNGTVCLVGKGVTFDTGGISIKGAKDMEKMKYDMSGAATVIATLGVVADLKLPLHIIGLAPAVENNVANNPQRPGDIIRMYNGKSVEVINTDAEGRLILGDALAYAEKYKPEAIIDLATLTGMCAYTFGDKAIAVMGNDEKLIGRLKKAGDATGERCWELPLWEEYRDQIKGHHSDLYNVGGAYGGTITAAMFLKEFVPEKTPWAHLDIAGTAWADSARYDCPKGATGVGVRLLIQLLSHWK